MNVIGDLRVNNDHVTWLLEHGLFAGYFISLQIPRDLPYNFGLDRLLTQFLQALSVMSLARSETLMRLRTVAIVSYCQVHASNLNEKPTQ
ncbi:hypothetical protein IQ235_08080 [Oscillatoriales cyanobacterium LEGE 11467]|uniref:Uncharacterized protein n=1 Tax=Zarconia navalis LEGE 11467 TaxID=1828826 RepID=A0A928VV03_9CYAN|nr:hypothetical protein [Zarconia navalis]MBE9040737.1 hypothetical protein [Zarconia navalis LEGE 11467]